MVGWFGKSREWSLGVEVTLGGSIRNPEQQANIE